MVCKAAWRAWAVRSADLAVLLLALLFFLMVFAKPAAAGTILYVDENNPSCTNGGQGTQAQPFCTIVAANPRAFAGDTVRVSTGTYSGPISLQNAGSPGQPIVFEAAPGADVTISSSGHGFVNYSKSFITIRGFHITNTLGGYGIYLYYANNNTITGNEVSFAGQPSNGATKYGIYVKGMTDTLVVNNVTHHNTDAGIYLTTDTTRVEVRNNVSYSNARGYTRAAPGIDVRVPGNTIAGNITHDNEDTGIQLYNGAANNVVVNNVSYNNGDHGIDALNSPNAVIVGNTVYKNTTSGINVEGTSSGATIRNNISVDNALASTATKGNIRVDANSVSGTSANHDLVNLSASGTMFTWGSTQYTSLAAFRTATGQEANGIQAAPGWVAPATGDFHLTSGSPAIDSADSGAPSQSAADLEGLPRIDDPATSNSGTGPREYDDRGAHEFQPGGPPGDQAPVARLTVTPSAGAAPVPVTADASTSTDDGGIVSYRFDFGDGTPAVGPQLGATATHTYDQTGTFTVTVTVTDTIGQTSTDVDTVTVTTPVIDEVHYTFTGPTSVAFDWRGSADDIRYGPTAGYGSTVIAQTPSPLPYSSLGPFKEAHLTGLQANSVYHYSIGGGPDRTFTTAPAGSYRFDVEGDIGDSTSYGAMVPVQQQIAGDDPAFVLATGDLTYGNSHGQAVVDQHFNDVMAWSREAAYMPAWGNHDWEEPAADDLRNYKGRFAIPNQHASVGAPSQGCCGEDWGWFDAGNVRFISYPEPYTGATWTDWQTQADPIFAQAQSDPTIRFIVTYGHRPAYSTGHHSGSATLAGILDTFGDRYPEYDVNFNGHSHDYERFLPIHGVTHITAAGGGASLEPGWTSNDPNTAFRAMHLAHVRVDVSATSLHIEAVCGPATSLDEFTCTQGSVIDQVTIGPQDPAPNAVLGVTPSSGLVPLEVIADATASTDDAGIDTYAFDFGDGTIVGPQAGDTATHTYTQPGTYTVTLTVADTAGQTDTDTRTVSAQQDQPPNAVLTVTPSSGIVPVDIIADASGSTDTDGTPIDTYTFNFGDGTVVGPQSGATATHTYLLPGEYTVTLTVTDTAGLSSTATQTVQAVDDLPPTADLTVTPSSGAAPLDVTADASASTDPDATPIATYTFDFGDGTVVGPQVTATATHTYVSSGDYTVTVTVTDTAGLSGTDTASVNVSPNLVGNPGFETNLVGWNANGTPGATLSRVAGGHSGGFSARMANTGTTRLSSCTLNDSPNWIFTTQAGTYTGSIWVRSDTSNDLVKIRFREYAKSNGAQLGQATANVHLTTSWQQVSLSYTVASPGQSTLDLVVYTSNVAAGAICFHADDASITRS